MGRFGEKRYVGFDTTWLCCEYWKAMSMGAGRPQKAGRVKHTDACAMHWEVGGACHSGLGCRWEPGRTREYLPGPHSLQGLEEGGRNAALCMLLSEPGQH